MRSELPGRKLSGASTEARKRNPPPRTGAETRLWPQAAALRQLYPTFVGVPARRIYEQSRGTLSTPGELATRVARDRLGVVIVLSTGGARLLGTLQALLPQCASLTDIEYQVVVVDNDSPRGLVKLCQEFPHVSVISSPSSDGGGDRFNAGLRHLGTPRYVLVMHGGVEFSSGALVKMMDYLREHQSVVGVVAAQCTPRGNLQAQRLSLVELAPRRHGRQ
jgi:hypothetical protein